MVTDGDGGRPRFLGRVATAIRDLQLSAVLRDAATDKPVYSPAPFEVAIQRRTRSRYGPGWPAKEVSSAPVQPRPRPAAGMQEPTVSLA